MKSFYNAIIQKELTEDFELIASTYYSIDIR